MGIVTAWLAVRSDDGLVVDDYYKQGLAINQVLDRSEARAAQLGLQATLSFDPQGDRVRVVLSEGVSGASRPTLRLVHPTRAGMDQVVVLGLVPPGVYEGALAAAAPGTLACVLEDSGGWRLGGDWTCRGSASDPATPRTGNSGGGGAMSNGKRLMWILWPAFLVAGIAEGVFFTLVRSHGPAPLRARSDLGRTAIYSIGFFLFWALRPARAR